MANNWQLGMIAGLDQNQSRAKINSQIDKLKGQLKDVSLTAKIDTKKISDIQNQLTNLQVSLTNVKISDKALNDMVSQINNALKGIQIPNINIVGNGNQRFVNNITNGFKQSANAIESFKNSLSNAGKSSSEIDNIVKKVQSLNVQIDSLRFSESTNGLMNVNVAGLDEFGNKVKITQTLLQDLQTMQWNVSNTTTSVVSTKELERINNAFTDYTAKLAQFKSTNTNILSGLTQPLADFESKLAGLKNGTVSIDEVKNAFKLLGTEASKITENFTGQLSKTDAAIRKLAQGDEIMDKLKASFKGLNNTPKEITKELNSVLKLLQNVKNIESKEGRTANWSEAYRKWANEVDKLQAKLSVLQKQQASMTTPQVFKTSELRNADIPYMTKVSNTIEKQMAEIQKMANAKGWQKFEVKGVEEADGKIKALTLTVRDAEGALKQFTMQRAKLQGSGKAQTGLMQVGDVKVLETASQAQEKLAQSTEKANAKLADQANKIQLSTDVTKLTTDYQKFGVVSQQVENNLKELKAAHESVINAKGTDRLAIEIEKYDTALAKAKSSMKELTTTQVSMNQRTSQMTAMQEWMRKNSAATQLCGVRVRELIDECKTCDKVRFDGIKNEFKQIQVEAGKAGKLGNSFFGSLIDQASKFAQWVGVSGLVMQVGNAVRQTGRNVIELDDALTNISYTMDVTKSQLENIGNASLDTAIELKTSASTVLDAVKTYANATETADSILNKAKPTIMMSNVSGMDTEQTVDILQGTMEQFDLAEDKLMYISDVMQTVSANMPYDFAKGLRELSEGIQASGSVAKDSGYDLERYTALLGTLIAKTRQSGSELGRSLRTMFVRTTKASSSALANGEVTEEDLSNAEKALRRVGIEVRSDIDTFKSFDEIMGELYNKVDSLSEVDLSNIAYEVASTRQTNVFKMMIKAYGEYQDMAEKAYSADGATLANQEQYAESLKGKLEGVGAIWEKIGDDALNSDFLKGLVDVGTEVSSLIEKFGLLKTAVVGIGTYAGIKNVGVA